MKAVLPHFAYFVTKAVIKMGTLGTRVLILGKEGYKKGNSKGKEEPCEIGLEL